MIDIDNKVDQIIKLNNLQDKSALRSKIKSLILQKPDLAVRESKLLRLLQKQPDVYDSIKEISTGLARVEDLIARLLDPVPENPRVFFNHPELYDPLYLLDKYDDFIWGSSETGEVGDLGWNVTGPATTVAQLAAIANHYGLIELSTAAVIGSVHRIHLGAAVTDTPLWFDHINRIVGIVRSPLTVTVRVRFGLGDNMGNATFGNNGVFFEYDSSVSANWLCKTRAGAAETSTTTGTPLSTTIYHKLEAFVRDDLEVDFYIDDDPVASHSTNIPTATALNCGFAVHALAAAIRNLNVDYFRLQGRKLELATRV